MTNHIRFTLQCWWHYACGFPIRASSNMSQEPWPCNCKSPKEVSKGIPIQFFWALTIAWSWLLASCVNLPLGPLYTRLGANPIHVHQVLNLVQPCHMKVMRPNFRPRCWEESVVKRIKLSCTANRDVHYPMDEPNPVHVESSGQRKACLGFFKPFQMFGAKIVSFRTSHGMSECLGPTLV
jgi:hypothetical protein